MRALLLWPLGVALALVHQEVEAVSAPVYVVLAAGYLVLAGVLLHRLAARHGGVLGVLAATPVVLFVVAGWTGAPTGAEPAEYQLNTAVLVAAALALVVAVPVLLVRYGRGDLAAAVPALVLLLVGTGGYLVNLLGRVAVVLVGAADRQAGLEATYWDASDYLRGLPGNDDVLALVLTWMDLVQLGYVVAVYVASAGLARVLVGAGVLPARSGRRLATTAASFAALLTAAVVLAIALPHDLDTVPAGIAFGLSIPFVTTLFPFVIAVVVLRPGGTPSAPPSSPAPRSPA